MSIRILIGCVRDRLKDLPDESVHCVVTSPPYFGLRDYGTAKWDGGEAGCDHLGEPMRIIRAYVNANTGVGIDRKNAEGRQPFGAECGKCGARRVDSQIGLEPTPDAFVAAMVEVFREVRRVLRKDGTLWLNLGDSYSAMRDAKAVPDTLRDGNGTAVPKGSAANRNPSTLKAAGLKHKDLIGIPWRVAFALQADGWWLRQDIIWHKPNPMPESVRDRCTKAHEYLFLLTKSERYFYDAEAIAEEAARAGEFNNATPQHKEYAISRVIQVGETRNKRSVWTIATQPFSEAHFATFPPELPELCIKAGCPAGGTVLYPFGGAGTTGLVADRLGRNAILIELNPEYAAIAERRVRGDAPLFAEVSA